MSVILVHVISLASCLCAQGNFLALNESARPSGQRISTAEVVQSLNSSIEQFMGEVSGINQQRVGAIERSIRRTFQALPKNDMGRLLPTGVRYIVHNYFAREHGWLLTGLEGQYIQVQGNASDLHDASILQEMAPALVELMLESRQGGRGLSFEDVVIMIAAVERLCLQESIALLHSSYHLNGLSTNTALAATDLQEVLRSYLIVFRQAFHANLVNPYEHAELKERMAALSPTWLELVEYAEDAVFNHAYANQEIANPFATRTYSFDAAASIVESLAHNYGRWQNSDCVAMKEHLMTLDAYGTGRVPLDRFYDQPKSALYHFHESKEYLRSIGALDDSSASNPQVLIANYVVGPTNCVAQSAYYSVCCLNECDVLMNELEGKVQAPVASPEQLLRLVSNMPSSTVDAPRQLSESLASKLREVGARHDGAVPLTGRLFAQWLHFAFPNECPYPMQTSTSALTPSQWWNGTAIASEEEMAAHANFEDELSADASDEMAQWTDDELLPLTEYLPPPHVRFSVGGFAGCLMRFLPLLLMGRYAFNSWQSAKLAHGGSDGAKHEFDSKWV